jgi:hypothetical protein
MRTHLAVGAAVVQAQSRGHRTMPTPKTWKRSLVVAVAGPAIMIGGLALAGQAKADARDGFPGDNDGGLLWSELVDAGMSGSISDAEDLAESVCDARVSVPHSILISSLSKSYGRRATVAAVNGSEFHFCPELAVVELR